MTRPISKEAPTGTPIPVPSAILLRDGCGGLDDGSAGVSVGVVAGSEAMRDIEDTTGLGDVVKRGDGFESVAFARANTIGPLPKTALKTVEPLQHPALASYPFPSTPQHQVIVAEPLILGQGYTLLKLSMFAVMGQSDLGGELRMSQD